MRYLLFIIAFVHFSISSAQKSSDLEITINLHEKEVLNEYGTMNIIIKYLDGSNRIDTLDTTKEFKRDNVIEYKSAKIFLNVKYRDRKAGFYKYINQKGKLSYEVLVLKNKLEVRLGFLKNQFTYQELLNLTLTDHKNYQQGIYLNDYLSYWTFSSAELFQLSNIFSNDSESKDREISFKIESNKITAFAWVKNDDDKSIKKAKQKAEQLFEISQNTLHLNFKNLKFYFQNNSTFKYEYSIEIKEK